ncbi:hypothetical protein N7G274_002803 [Stereocaulon virgatum]|uniref:Protein kinase domain-containing protein n=1 Tax=Stereocaulon virgatum TaxID=373712 RepID=A0ABR4AGV4_9LECA
MANLSQKDRNIIAENPLDTSPDHLRELLRKIEQSYKPGFLSPDSTATGPDLNPPKVISRLLYTLQGHEVALNLRSKIGSDNVASELSELFKCVQRGHYNYEHYRALSRLIIKRAPDVDIWNAVLDLIITVSRTTPPTSIRSSFDGTPVTISSSSFQGSEQTRQIIESAMFYEIKRCTYRNVDGFFEKYFEGRRWSHKSKEIYNAVKKEQYRDERWTDFPDPSDGDAVWKWLSRVQDNHLSDSPGVFYTTASTSDLTGAEARRQLDVFTKRRGIENTEKHNWKDVRIIGELKQSKWELKKILLQLARYMRDAFTAHPPRRFIHGFFLHNTTMELWVFDRSGPYSSGEFNIHEEPDKFIQAITGYALMDDEELGLDTFTEMHSEDRFITISTDARGKEKRMQLDEAPFVKQRAVVCRGTTCFRNIDQSGVVKFSWTSDKRPPEADHLRLAQEKGVEGIAKLTGYQRITSISELRSGLTFPSPHQFRSGTASASTSFSQTQQSQSFGPVQNLSISRTSSKRKRPGDEQGSQKKSRSNSQKSKLNQQFEATQQSGEPAVSLFEPDDGNYSNRVLGCLAIAPAGKALSEFAQIPDPEKSVASAIKELLIALRDAINAHRSLYLKGNILHRDVSENNIIITGTEKEDGNVAGMLIDLDLAKVAGSGRSGARHQTGTMEFMAIEVLQGIDHTYRHDLESFFYVLVWLCARRGWDFCRNSKGRPKESRLRRWYTGSFKDIAEAKLGYMHVDGFEYILDEFPSAFDCVKPLCMDLRGILFPLQKDGTLFKGTREDPPEKLYNSVTEAFESALADIAPSSSEDRESLSGKKGVQ